MQCRGWSALRLAYVTQYRAFNAQTSSRIESTSFFGPSAFPNLPKDSAPRWSILASPATAALAWEKPAFLPKHLCRFCSMEYR
jgi:hypothetical protein